MTDEKCFVSIFCLTYNHEKFITQTLKGFLIQKTNFYFEILIHDDASSDGTAEIIKEFTAKYPTIFKPIYQTENQWSQGVKRMNAKFNIPRCKGKYIAFCEGDDYWTDPLKLQKQVDFLEANKDYSFCFHDALELFQSTGKQQKRIGAKKIDTVVDLKSVLIENNFPTASLLFRTSAYPTTQDVLSATSKGDYALVVRLAEKGFGKYFPEVMCAYRIHEGGVWSSKSSDYKLAESVKFYDLLYDYFKDPALRKVITQKRNKTMESQSLEAIRNGHIWAGFKGILRYRNFTSDSRLKSASVRKILSAIKSGLIDG